jgi:hypothetical protein
VEGRRRGTPLRHPNVAQRRTGLSMTELARPVRGELGSSTPYGIGQDPAQALVLIWLGGNNMTSPWLT